MKALLIIWMLMFVERVSFGQTADTKRHDSILSIINNAGENYSFKQLSAIIDYCSHHYNKSPEVSKALTGWLRESHPVYSGKSASQSNQFRVFLLYSLSRFKPNDELYDYIKYELQFADYGYNIAAAAYTARNFDSNAVELVTLFQPFFKNSFRDEYVEISSPTPEYPLSNPTRVRYEILETLMNFGEDAYDAVPMISSLRDYLLSNPTYNDAVLLKKCTEAVKYITEVTPECCRKHHDIKTVEQNSQYSRHSVNAADLMLSDQEGRKIKFGHLSGKPFVLTFFYTRCTNPLKCLATVHRLAKLQQELSGSRLARRVGIYGMTFDPEFDKPSVIKEYGELYGMKFNDNVRFFQAENAVPSGFTSQLQLRVSYGFGSVNQHGTQLFVFDKKGRLSKVYDNEKWSVEQVVADLKKLAKE